MDGNLGDLVSGEGQGAVLGISEFPIVGGQFLPHIYEGEIHEAASGGAAMLFGGGNQAGAVSGSLALRVDCQQPEVTAFAAQFDVYATRQHSILKQHEESSFLKKGANFLRIGAIGVNEETLGAKGIVYQTRDCGRVGEFGGADLRRIRQQVDFTSGAAADGICGFKAGPTRIRLDRAAPPPAAVVERLIPSRSAECTATGH